MLLLVEILALLVVANGTPVLAKKILGTRWVTPVDFGAHFVDGRPLFGKSKTWRGLVTSVVVTGAFAGLIGFGAFAGCLFAAASLAGDLFSSFIKRRLGMVSSSKALGLDQLPEALFPLLVFYDELELSFARVALILLLFFVIELVASRILYAVNLRDRPY